MGDEARYRIPEDSVLAEIIRELPSPDSADAFLIAQSNLADRVQMGARIIIKGPEEFIVRAAGDRFYDGERKEALFSKEAIELSVLEIGKEASSVEVPPLSNLENKYDSLKERIAYYVSLGYKGRIILAYALQNDVTAVMSVSNYRGDEDIRLIARSGSNGILNSTTKKGGVSFRELFERKKLQQNN